MMPGLKKRSVKVPITQALLAVFWAALDSGVSEILSFCKNLGYFGLGFLKSP